MSETDARTLAEIVAEGRRLEATTEMDSAAWDALISFQHEHFPVLARVAEKTLALFAALDRERPGWREETCVVSGDEVCRAWYELEKSLGLGPDGEGKEKGK